MDRTPPPPPPMQLPGDILEIIDALPEAASAAVGGGNKVLLPPIETAPLMPAAAAPLGITEGA